MLDINHCRNTAKILATKAQNIMDISQLDDLMTKMSEFENEYQNKYMFSSTAIHLTKLQSFNKWISSVANNKDIITPILVNKMVNNNDLYALSAYQALHDRTEARFDLNDYENEFYEFGGGENSLALITGCQWIENDSDHNL